MTHAAPLSVLIVEDEFLIRMMLAETLSDAGYAVLEAATAEEAIAHLRQTENMALMITDLTLPGTLDGIALARWARGLRVALPIIYVTGRPDSISADGMDAREAVVAKPYLPSEIVAAVGKMLGR